MKKKLLAALLAVLALAIAAVTVFAADTPAYTVDENGNITLDVEIILYGDVNKDGEINAKDVTQIRRYMNDLACSLTTGTEAENAYRFEVGDVNKDNFVNAKDVTQIRRYMNSLPSAFDSLS